MTLVGDWRLRAILHRFQKLRGRSVHELRERVAQAVSAELERRRLTATVGKPAERSLWANLDPVCAGAGIRDAATLHAHFSTRRSAALFAGIGDGSTAAELRTERWTAERARLIDAAEAIVAGRFDLLGHHDLSFGTPIDWHLDPVSGKRAPQTHWSRIPFLDARVVGDHKVIWEINRHQHFMTLGRAFQVTGRASYAECFAEHLVSWLDANPPKTGMNWASSLEIAYRSIAWLWSLELFRGAPALAPVVMQRLLTYLHLHGRHLERYLSTYFSPNTHLTGEALGLLYLGVLLPEFRSAERWKRLGWQILEEELSRQVHPDGVYFEQATYYHRYTVDIYLHAVLLARSGGIPVPEAMRRRLTLAVGHLADLTRGDGTIPLIGDDDGGRLVALEERSYSDARASLAVASVVLGEGEYAVVAGAATEEVLWLLGAAGVRDVTAALGGSPPSHGSRLFADGGYAIMRDGWGRDSNHAVIDCGPLGAMNCGHAHSDALAIEISARGCPMLVDPGTFTYTGSASERDRFRHSAAHNTLTVDGQSASIPAGPFSWSTRADARVEQWWSGARVDRLVGSHSGFERLPDPAVHRRSVLFVRGDYWIIVDSVLAAGEHDATAHFHWAEGSQVVAESSSSAWIRTPCATGAGRLFFAVAGDVGSLEWGQDWISPSYGVRTHAPYARLSSRGAGRREIITVLVPMSDLQTISVRELPTNSGHAVVIDRPGVLDLILLESGGTVRADGLAMDGEAAFIRRDSASGDVRFVALFGAQAELSGAGFRVRTDGAVEGSLEGGRWQIEGKGRVTIHGQDDS